MLPVEVDEVRLTLGGRQITLHVGGLDPVDTTSGLQSRLRSLGFYGGDESGELDARTRDATAAFQLRHRLPVTGQADPATRRKLVELYGS